MRSFTAMLFLLFAAFSSQLKADEIIDGQIGPGALYRLASPANWNGSLVLYAHGYTGTELPVALPPEGALLISALTSQGFAVAYSSFSENG